MISGIVAMPCTGPLCFIEVEQHADAREGLERALIAASDSAYPPSAAASAPALSQEEAVYRPSYPGVIVNLEERSGAAPTRFMTNIAIQEANEAGEVVVWGEHVSDEQYGRAPSVTEEVVQSAVGLESTPARGTRAQRRRRRGPRPSIQFSCLEVLGETRGPQVISASPDSRIEHGTRGQILEALIGDWIEAPRPTLAIRMVGVHQPIIAWFCHMNILIEELDTNEVLHSRSSPRVIDNVSEPISFAIDVAGIIVRSRLCWQEPLVR
jgi:hypothetical protein